MSEGLNTTAVHYFFLLREDEAGLATLWESLAAGSPTSSAAALDLGLDAAGLSGKCQIVHRISGAETDFCLLMLPRLAAVEVYVRPGGGAGSHDAGWRGALDTIGKVRRRQARLGIPLFAESTVLASGETDRDRLGSFLAALGADEPDTAALADNEARGRPRLLTSRLKAELAGGSAPELMHLSRPVNGRRLYAVAAADPETFLATWLPQIDAAINFLARQSGHFAQQRHTIAAERASVDHQVGELLHRQVVAAGAEARLPEHLDEKIGTLSRLFGMLATDSLLVRQSEDHLRGNLENLAAALAPCLATDGAPDGIGEHYRRILSDELNMAGAEADKLNFARRNAQAAIEVVRTQVELLRAGEEAAIQTQTRELLSRSLVVQQERLALQVAAGFVEFVLLFYYVLKSWEGVVGQQTIDQIQPLIRMITVGLMSLGATAGTHFLAGALHRRSWRNPGLWVSAAVMVMTLAAMIFLSR